MELLGRGLFARGGRGSISGLCLRNRSSISSPLGMLNLVLGLGLGLGLGLRISSMFWLWVWALSMWVSPSPIKVLFPKGSSVPRYRTSDPPLVATLVTGPGSWKTLGLAGVPALVSGVSSTNLSEPHRSLSRCLCKTNNNAHRATIAERLTRVAITIFLDLLLLLPT